MKKYLVIGNPIGHSLSPELHNYWLKKNNIDGIYDKEKLEDKDLDKFILRLRNKDINGANVTVPFKKKIISNLDKLSPEAEITQSVNTIYLRDDKIIGDNTDVIGFELAIKEIKFEIKGRRIFIIGAGGVVPSLICALNKMKPSNIIVSNRTKNKAENLKDLFGYLTVVDWKEIPNFDMVINATSIGLNNDEELDLDLSKIGKDKFFYDVIYNPGSTNFLKTGEKLGNKTENGKKMFLHQAAQAFKIWHGIKPEIDQNVLRLLEK